MTTTSAARPAARDVVPDPLRPPTAWSALRRVVPGLRKLTADLTLVAPALLVVAALQLRGAVGSWQPGLGYVAIEYAPWIAPTLGVAGLVVWGALVRWSRRPDRRWRPHRPLAWASVLLCVWAVLAARSVDRRVGKFTELKRGVELGPPLVGADGATYRALQSTRRELPWTIGRETGGNWAHTRIVSLRGPRADEPPLTGAQMIRPAASREGAGLRRAGALVLYVDGEGVCSIAYDTGTGKRAAPAELSPFLLLEPDDEGSETDLRSFMARTGQPWERRPPEAALIAAIDQVNPWVRDAARRLVRAGGAKLYPEATKKL